MSLSHEVSLQLTIESASLSGCIGGDHLGLTNTSLVVEYRITSSSKSVGEWIYLFNVIVGTNRTATFSRVQLHDSASADGFQIRVLQLEHGGGWCNCWRVNNIDVDCGQGITASMTATDTSMCSQQGFRTSSRPRLNGAFCLESASRARGMITEVYCSVSNNSEPCPGDSDTLLPSEGPALPSHCETSDFRM